MSAEGVLTEEARGPASRVIHRASRWVGVVEQLLGGLLLVTILVVVMLQVLQRFGVGVGGVWTGELARVSLVWCTFVLAGHLTGRDRQITLEVIDHAVTARMRRWIKVFAHLVVALVAFGFVREAYGLISAGSPARLPSLGIPQLWLYVVPLVGFALTGVRSVLAVFVGRNG